jgi:GDP-L-fucose synthase
MIEKTDRIFVAGHRGMVGAAVVRALNKAGYSNLLLRSHSELDLRNKEQVKAFFQEEEPQVVVMAAAKVGGINDNMLHKAEFLMENLEMQNNVIYQAFKMNVKKFCFLGSSCIYPCNCPQPIKEEYLLNGPFEPTNEGYAIAKIAGYKLGYYLADQYGFNAISLMPCNLYGTNDHYDLNNSHVLPALIRKFSEAVENEEETVELWGTGVARREFMHVDDLAAAVLFTLGKWNSPEFINVGTGQDVSIKELAEMVAEEAGFKGKIVWDSSKPDGMLRKCMDVSKLENLGFRPTISLREGIRRTLADFRQEKQSGDIRM